MPDHKEDSSPEAGWALKGLLSFATADASDVRSEGALAVEAPAVEDDDETTLTSEDGP